LLQIANEGAFMNVKTKKTANLSDERLSQKMERLEECLLAPMAAGTQNWGRRVGRALDEIGEAWNRHQTDAESEDGPFSPDEFKGTMLPALDKRVENLQQEHQRLRGLIEAIRTRLDEVVHSSNQSPKVLDLLRIRRRGRILLEEIRKHKEKETILLMDNVTVDIGVGD
jgi:hypothetical protein